MVCPWCHNPEGIRFEPEVVWRAGRCLGDRGCVEACPEKALSASDGGIAIDRDTCRGCGECADYCPSEALEIHGRAASVEEIFQDVGRDAGFYDSSGGGVTLSGGEPLSQPEAALAFLKMLKEAGIHAALDTCGAAGKKTLEKALDLVDLVLLDIKTADPARHLETTGVPWEKVAASARLAASSGVPVWVRTPVIPGYTSDEENIRAVARFVEKTFGRRCERHDLLAFGNLCRSKYEQLGRPFALAEAGLLQAGEMEGLAEAARREEAAEVRWSGPTVVGEDN